MLGLYLGAEDLNALLHFCRKLSSPLSHLLSPGVLLLSLCGLHTEYSISDTPGAQLISI